MYIYIYGISLKIRDSDEVTTTGILNDLVGSLEHPQEMSLFQQLQKDLGQWALEVEPLFGVFGMAPPPCGGALLGHF